MLGMGTGGTAAASDFWDDVRQPGRAAARALGREARHALADGRRSAALKAATTAVSLDPEAAASHVLLGRVLSVMSHHREAAAAYGRALALSASALDGSAEGGRAARSACAAADYRLASVILRRLVSHMPAGKDRNALFALQGDVLMALGPASLQAALTAYEHALRQSAAPDAMLELALALALRRAGHPPAGHRSGAGATRRGSLEDAIMRLPLPPTERHARLAMARAAAGNATGADRAWKLATEAGPWSAIDRRGPRGAVDRRAPRGTP